MEVETKFSDEIERVATEIVDAAFKIHTTLGPGLLESAYEAVLAYELTKRGLTIQREVSMPVVYEDVRIDVGYRVDLIVNGCIIIELKAVEKLLPIHEAQLLTYLKLSSI